jgi:hypothetical protein
MSIQTLAPPLDITWTRMAYSRDMVDTNFGDFTFGPKWRSSLAVYYYLVPEEDTADGLPPGAALADLGAHRLKDLGRPERIFQLTGAGLPAEFPPLRSLGNPALPNNLPASCRRSSAGAGRWPRSER